MPESGHCRGFEEGRCVLDMSVVCVLTVRNILHPFLVELMPVEDVHHGLACDLTVSGVATPFPVGAVRWDATMNVA